MALSLISLGTSAEASSPVLPISTDTPGALNPQVTQSNIQTTICVSGYTTTVRPTSSYTTTLKKKQLATTYSFYHDTKLGDFEEDHLISLEIGGSPSSPLNLWPEPYGGADGAKVKDQLENKLHELVCQGLLSLASAQKQIVSNWFLEYQKYVLNLDNLVTPTPSQSQVESPPVVVQPSIPSTTLAINSPTPFPSGSSTSTRPVGATGKCNDGTYSFATSHRGMCSSHKGVETFYN